jgi:hypothetical protein
MNEERKAELIERHRHINVNHEWWEHLYEEFDRVCKILGIDLDPVGRLRQRQRPDIEFSGFCSQGDGASWSGVYRAWHYEAGYMHRVNTYDLAPEGIREYAPRDKELHRIAGELCMLARLYYPAYAQVAKSGHYSHAFTMHLSHYEPLEGDEDDWADEVHRHVEDTLTDLFRDLADWLYARLEQGYNYLTSDEAVWDTIEANELDEEEEEV